MEVVLRLSYISSMPTEQLEDLVLNNITGISILQTGDRDAVLESIEVLKQTWWDASK